MTREARNNINPRYIYNNRLGRDERRVLDYLFSRRGEGASVQRTAANVKITYDGTRRVFTQLVKAGEIFLKEGKIYCSTAWAMAFDPKPFVEHLREELERDLFGPEPTPRVRAFLAEFSAAAKLGLSVDEGFHFAQRRMLESGPQGVST